MPKIKLFKTIKRLNFYANSNSVGYMDVMRTSTKGRLTKTLVIRLAASTALSAPVHTKFYTAASYASDFFGCYVLQGPGLVGTLHCRTSMAGSKKAKPKKS